MDFLQQPISEICSNPKVQLIMYLLITYVVGVFAVGRYFFFMHFDAEANKSGAAMAYTLGATLWFVVFPMYLIFYIGPKLLECVMVSLMKMLMTKKQREEEFKQ